MFKLTIASVGGLKEAHWKAAESEFATRLRPFAKLDIAEVAAERLGGSKTPAQAMAAEAGRLRARIRPGAFVVALDRTGKAARSETFATMLETEGGRGREIAFVIGGTEGLDAVIVGSADAVLSLSEMTFTHEMARIILLEQLYRAMTIIAGKPYHR
jgi:23S rRNA (pseudouridine1915-N3)-methyltransferase